MIAVALLSLSLALLPARGTSGRKPFQFEGKFVEGCTCKQICQFEITGADTKCSAIGAYEFSKGTYGGKSIAGTRVAFAVSPKGWLHLYVDGGDAGRRMTVVEMFKVALKDWGKLQPVEHKAVAISGKDGRYVTKVDGGRIMVLQSEPVTYPGHAEAITYGHLFDNTLHKAISQARTITGTFHDGKHSFSFQGSNGFFNANLKEKGIL